MNSDEWTEIEIERIQLERAEMRERTWDPILYPDMEDSLSD